MDFFKGYGTYSSNIIHVSPRETLKLIQKGAYLVDVREEQEYKFKTFLVDNLIHLPNSLFYENYLSLDYSNPLIFVCATGLRSKLIIEFLQAKNYTNIANMAGGIVEWERDLLPLNTDLKYQLSGSCACMLKRRNN